MRIIVTGSRYNDYFEDVRNALHHYDYKLRSNAATSNITLVTSDCKGVDSAAVAIAESLGWPIEIFGVDTDDYGVPQTEERNLAMVDSGADVLLRFPGGLTCLDLEKKAYDAGIHVKIWG